MSQRSLAGSLPSALLLGMCADGAVAAAPPPADEIRPAQPAALFDPGSRCRELQQAPPEDPAAAVILFRVGPSGVPSQASVKESSSDTKLDAAAVSCVMRLRFQPPTVLGEGTPVASWEQIAFKWPAPPPKRNQTSAPAGQNTGAALAAGAGATGAVAAGAAAATATAGSNAAAGTTAARAGVAGAAGARAGAQSAEVRVCVDQSGKLAEEPAIVRSSGDAAFDAAALSVARSGAGHYRAVSADGKTAAGCLRLAFTAE